MYEGEAPDFVKGSMASGMQHTKDTQMQRHLKSNQSEKVRPATEWLQGRLHERRLAAEAPKPGNQLAPAAPGAAQPGATAQPACGQGTHLLFTPSDHTPGGELEVQETDGGPGWRLATLHYHHSQTHIVLHFPTTDEYEGLGGGYTFSNGLMRDGDGDPINHRPCGSGPLATQPTLAAATHTNRSAKPPRVAKQSG